ncbi:MAG: xseB [Bacteroidetes bacterium]|nr:xseB [Bacteroidota bacterium]
MISFTLFHEKGVFLHFNIIIMEQPKTYKDSFDELQVIVKKMEDAEISVDELSAMIQRASLLITICKDKLTKTEEEVAHLIEKL